MEHQILVALTPGLLTAVLGLVVVLWTPMKNRLKEYSEVPALLERVREISHDLSLLGSAAFAVLGYQGEDILLIPFTLAWFVTFSKFANSAALRAEKLRELEDKKAHRRMAGTMRSIARSVMRAELDRRAEDS